MKKEFPAYVKMVKSKNAKEGTSLALIEEKRSGDTAIATYFRDNGQWECQAAYIGKELRTLTKENFPSISNKLLIKISKKEWAQENQ